MRCIKILCCGCGQFGEAAEEFNAPSGRKRPLSQGCSVRKVYRFLSLNGLTIAIELLFGG
jgi:hypothetical protein